MTSALSRNVEDEKVVFVTYATAVVFAVTVAVLLALMIVVGLLAAAVVSVVMFVVSFVISWWLWCFRGQMKARRRAYIVVDKTDDLPQKMLK
jgi:hypothetical protein